MGIHQMAGVSIGLTPFLEPEIQSVQGAAGTDAGGGEGRGTSSVPVELGGT